MKKINILLMAVTIVLSIITILGKLDQGLVVALKNLTIIFTVTAPYIVKKLFKIDLGEGFTFFWVIFIFMAHYLGVIASLYSDWAGFDKITHTISGVITAYVAFYLLSRNKIKNKWFGVLFIISFSWLCAGMWETFEFTCDKLFDGNAQHAETGVDDTMGDMLVAFAGSIIFSIWYLFQNRKVK